jgi:hypothetical protein
MKQIVQFDLEEAGPVMIEVEDTENHRGIERVSRTGEGILKAEKTFMEGISRVKPAAEAVLNAFREMNTPDEIHLEFGLKFSAKAGAILASADGEATFKVSLTWKGRAES